MEFKLQKKDHPNVLKYTGENHLIAKKFADAIKKELGDFLKCVILFGSSTRTEKTPYEKDIDILMIIDDLTLIISSEVVEAYRIITENTAAKVSKRLHITTNKLSTFWDQVRNGDPLAVNMLRDGVPIYDIGIFEPMQALLFQGRIRPTKESVWIYFTRAPLTIKSAEWHLLQASLDLYWAVIDAAHAALMHVGEIPPGPSHVASLIQEKLAKPGHVHKKNVQIMDFFYNLSKKITHREVVEIPGSEFDKYKALAKDFIDAMRKVIEGK